MHAKHEVRKQIHFPRPCRLYIIKTDKLECLKEPTRISLQVNYSTDERSGNSFRNPNTLDFKLGGICTDDTLASHIVHTSEQNAALLPNRRDKRDDHRGAPNVALGRKASAQLLLLEHLQ